jgi:hypothetical protein
MRRLLGLAGALAERVTAAGRATAAALAMVVVPDSDEEAAVLLGLAGIAVTFLIRGQPDLAIGVPSALLVAIGLGFTLRRGR